MARAESEKSVREAITRRAGAQHVAAQIRATGGAPAAAASLEELSRGGRHGNFPYRDFDPLQPEEEQMSE